MEPDYAECLKLCRGCGKVLLMPIHDKYCFDCRREPECGKNWRGAHPPPIVPRSDSQYHGYRPGLEFDEDEEPRRKRR